MMSLNKFLKILNPKFLSHQEQLKQFEEGLSETERSQLGKEYQKKKSDEILSKLNHHYNWKSLNNEYLRFFKTQILPLGFQKEVPKLFSMDYDLYIVADFIMPTCQTEIFDFLQSTPDQST